MENPTSSSVFYMDVKATQAVKVTDILQTSGKSNDDSTISSTRVFPNVQFESESSKEIEAKESGLSTSSLKVNQVRKVKQKSCPQPRTLLKKPILPTVWKKISTQQNLIQKIL